MKRLTLLDVLGDGEPKSEQPDAYQRLKQEIVGELTAVIQRELKSLETRLLEALRK